MNVQVDVLGPLRVRADDREVDLGGPRSRALVARLALAGGRPVSAATLIDDLWGLDTPADPANALQSIVSRTRRRLPADVLDSTPAGYVLRCAAVDAVELERLVAADRSTEALRLWRGEALADVLDFPFAAAEASRLEELRLTAIESSLAARVRTDPTVIAELAQLTRDHPYRDGFWRLHLTALTAHGRPNEALAAYDRLRTTLADELGADPSPELQALHVSILRGEQRPHRDHAALPVGLTSFVGRDGAIDDVRSALETHRLVTILGPGGAGKTRLAVEAARTTLDRFEDVWLAELAPVTGEDGILAAILTAVGLLEVAVLDRSSALPRPDERTRLIDGLRDVEGLLVLDNCEHLIDGAAAIAADVLGQAPKLRIIATSREPLRIIGEYAYQLSPLTTPSADDSVETALTHSAIQLFVLRAKTVDHAFELTPETLPHVREICRRLDGQPLAIELAAARLRRLSAGQVAERLSDRFRLLTGGSRTALPRHRTLRAVVEWSWDLLDDDERDLIERLAVFPAGVTADSAAAAHPELATEELLESLADKSLLVAIRGDTPRFRMLETLREYGVERLIDRGVAEQVREQHLEYFVAVVERQAVRLRGPEQVEATRELDAEAGNIMAALRFAVDRGDRARAGRLVASYAWFWSIRGQHVDGFTWAQTVLALPGEMDPASEICLQALAVTGLLARSWRGADDDGPAPWIAPVERILELWDAHHPKDPVVDVVLAAMDFFDLTGERELPVPDDVWTRATTRLIRLVLLENIGRVGESVELLDPTIEDFRAVGDRWGVAMALSQRGMVQSLDGQFEAALDSWEEAVPLLRALGAAEDAEFSRMKVIGLRIAIADAQTLDTLRDELDASVQEARRAGDRRTEILARMSLGHLEHVAGRHAAAAEHLELVVADLDVAISFGGGQLEAAMRTQLAVARACLDDVDAALAELARAGQLAISTQDMPIVAQVVSAGAVIAARGGDDERAARLLGAADVVRGRPDLMNHDAREVAAAVAASLGEERLAALRLDGEALGAEAAVALALRPVRP